MFVSTYNNNGLKDTLMILFEKSESDVQEANKSGDLVEIKNKETNTIVGYNLFNASTHLKNLTNGPVTLSEENIEILNDLIKEAAFERKIEAASGSNFVVGFIKKCEPVEGSDHLSVTQTEINDGKEVQIVCGASNIAQGQKVVVAKVGTIMPNGLIIWPGELKGVTSEGMVCSARELGLPQESDGIMVLDDDLETGTDFKL
ncbi:YtpR family tRNA-binding protein [Alkalibacterium sp. f15]|uniref:YtpR family tRNA-binding protein n=1 Tax=Alkalibacterium sp. f15 TaxID=3414029 RepID=UPI003BF88A98